MSNLFQDNEAERVPTACEPQRAMDLYLAQCRMTWIFQEGQGQSV